jgi:hypothetical protein
MHSDPPPPGEGKNAHAATDIVAAKIYDYALTPTPIGQDTPVPPRPQ